MIFFKVVNFYAPAQVDHRGHHAPHMGVTVKKQFARSLSVLLVAVSATLVPISSALAAAPNAASAPSATSTASTGRGIEKAISGGGPLAGASGSSTYSEVKGSSGGITPQYADGRWVCTVYSSTPYKNTIGEVRADGSQFCSGIGYGPQRIIVYLQKKNWAGFWTTVYKSSSNRTYYDTMTGSAIEWCPGTGEYRTWTTGYAANDKYLGSAYSATKKITCP